MISEASTATSPPLSIASASTSSLSFLFFSLNFSASEKIDIKKQTMEEVGRALYEERERERAIIGLQEGGRELGASGGEVIFIFILEGVQYVLVPRCENNY